MALDFPTAAEELETVLLSSFIPITEIIGGGGGEARSTQRLRKALTARGWNKAVIRIEKRINDVLHDRQSHEIDHVREMKLNGRTYRIALEIEWNNKDPFFDRDLENFKRLHADGAISLGIIITRGRSLQDNMRAMIRRFCENKNIRDIKELERWGYSPTVRQREAISKRMRHAKSPDPLWDAFSSVFVSDKFGEATTHWEKLMERIKRGVGNPCPLLLIGLPEGIVSFE